jgi:hypothetical protein
MLIKISQAIEPTRMSTSHSHRHIDENDLHQATGFPLRQGRHSVVNLADLIISFSEHRGPNLSELQENALQSFRKEKIYDLRDHIRIPIEEVILTYFVLFDDLFFFGSLSDRCDLAMDREESVNSGRRGLMIGREVNVKKKIFGMVEKTVGEKSCIIVLNSHREEFPGRYEKLKGYVETLLHEMCHAFFELWGCPQSECVGGYDKLGKTRHGRLWQDVALALEHAVRDRQFLNLDLCLNRVTSLALELVTMDEIVHREDLERWVMKREDLAEAIEIVYERQEDDCSEVLKRRKPARRRIGPATLVKGMEILGSKFFR